MAFKTERIHFLFCGLLVLAATLFYSSIAKAVPEWCVRELDRSDERVLVLHNPECDLRVLPRMYPQRDDDGKALPMQVQLRSLFAANQSREEDGVKLRYTVMRGCVSPGIPSKHADAEELAACPKGLMNYFSAPASDGAARIVVPAKRQLTIAEQNLKLAKDACEQLQDKPLVTEKDKKAADACVKQFTSLVFGANVKAPPSDEPDTGEKKPNKITNPEASGSTPVVANLETNNTDNKSQFVVPLFILLIGLSIYGAALTVLAIKINREKVELKNANQALVLDRKNQVQVLRKEANEAAKREYFGKNEAQLKAHKDKIEKDLKDAWHKLLADQQKEIASLKQANKVAQNSGAGSQSFDQLRNQLAGRDQQIAELRSEMNALAERNTILEKVALQKEAKAQEALAGRVVLETRISELSEHVNSVNAENADRRRELARKDQQIEDFRNQATANETAMLGYENQIRTLQLRLEQLLEAADGCGMGTGDKCRTMKKDTLPLGLKADQLAQIAKDNESKNTAFENHGANQAVNSEAQDLHDSGLENEGSDIAANRSALRSPRMPNDLAVNGSAPYRQEMPTLEHEVPLQRIAQEQMIHFRNAWVRLAKEFALVLDPTLRITEHTNVESVLIGLSGKLFALSTESKQNSDRLAALRQEHRFVEGELEVVKSELRKTTTQLNIEARVGAEMRQKFDVLAKDIKGENVQQKLFGYQLATVQADARAVKAEIRLQDANEELLQIKSKLAERDSEIETLKNERSLLEVAKKQLEEDLLASSDSNAVDRLKSVLGLERKDFVPARDVLLELPSSELLRLAKTVFHAIDHCKQRGVQLEYPLASDQDLSALRATLMIPLVADYPYEIPRELLSMADQGVPRMHNVVHDVLADSRVPGEVIIHKKTVTPPDGLRDDSETVTSSNPEHSRVQQRADISSTSVVDDDTSHTAS